jgi:hypothetical protein
MGRTDVTTDRVHKLMSFVSRAHTRAQVQPARMSNSHLFGVYDG